MRLLFIQFIVLVGLFPTVGPLCERAAARGHRVLFLGGDPGTAERSSSVLSHRYSGLRVAGTACPGVARRLR